MFCIRRSSFMISIHSRVVHLSHEEEASQSLSNAGEEMSAIFSITTDINDILLVLDRVSFLLLRPAVNQFLSRDQSCQKSGFNFWWRWEASKPIMTRRSNEAKNTNNFLIGIYRHDGKKILAFGLDQKLSLRMLRIITKPQSEVAWTSTGQNRTILWSCYKN